MAPSYWRTQPQDPPQRFVTGHMHRKVEYLLRNCSCGRCGRQLARQARVVKVERLENHALWRAYEAHRSQLRAHQPTPRRERSRPINCDLDDDEQMLFHGTGRNMVDSIAATGFDPARAHPGSRYGIGVYFSDESCKAHQYSTLRNSGREFTMIYSRVAPGRAVPFRGTQAAADRNFLVGMRRPVPADPVFLAQMHAGGFTARARQEWDSVDASEGQRQQVHRELIIFDSAQAYPEFIVTYRLDTRQEQRRLEQHQEARRLLLIARVAAAAVAGGRVGDVAASYLLRQGWQRTDVADWLLDENVEAQDAADWMTAQDGRDMDDTAEVAGWLYERGGWEGAEVPDWMLEQEGWDVEGVAEWLYEGGGWALTQVARWLTDRWEHVDVWHWLREAGMSRWAVADFAHEHGSDLWPVANWLWGYDKEDAEIAAWAADNRYGLVDVSRWLLEFCYWREHQVARFISRAYVRDRTGPRNVRQRIG